MKVKEEGFLKANAWPRGQALDAYLGLELLGWSEFSEGAPSSVLSSMPSAVLVVGGVPAWRFAGRLGFGGVRGGRVVEVVVTGAAGLFWGSGSPSLGRASILAILASH